MVDKIVKASEYWLICKLDQSTIIKCIWEKVENKANKISIKNISYIRNKLKSRTDQEGPVGGGVLGIYTMSYTFTVK